MTGGVAGVDPGLTGAITFLNDDGTATAHDMPIVRVHSKGYVNGYAVRQLIERYRPRLIVIEMQGVRPRQGISSGGQTMLTYGGIVSVALSMGIPVELVAAPVWKRKFGLLGTAKDACRVFMLKRFPKMAEPLRRKKDQGRADALAIAEFGKSLPDGPGVSNKSLAGVQGPVRTKKVGRPRILATPEQVVQSQSRAVKGSRPAMVH